jgi:hypothetical protein
MAKGIAANLRAHYPNCLVLGIMLGLKTRPQKFTRSPRALAAPVFPLRQFRLIPPAMSRPSRP